jgi:hypothetical protein
MIERDVYDVTTGVLSPRSDPVVPDVDHAHADSWEACDAMAAWSVERERQDDHVEEALTSCLEREFRSTRDRTVHTRHLLYDEARQRGISGRSKMNKDELERTVGW